MENEQPQTNSLRDTINAAVESVEENTSADVAAVAEPKAAPVATAEQLRAERARDESGKFAKEPAKPKEPAAQPQVTNAGPKPRPQSWKKDYDPHWNKLVTGQPLTPEEARAIAEYAEQRESEYAKGVSTYKTEAERAKPIIEALAPFARQSGMHPAQMVQNMVLRHQSLVNPQTKVQTWLALARDYGIPVQLLLQQMMQAQQPRVDAEGKPIAPPVADPRLGMLSQELGSIKNEFSRWRAAQQAAQEQQIAKEIENFSSNREKYPHYETVKQTMADLLERGLASELDGAYSLALRMPQHDDIRTAMEDEARKAADAAKARESAERARSAQRRNVIPRSSTPGSAGGSSGEGKKSLRDTIAEAADAHAGRI